MYLLQSGLGLVYVITTVLVLGGTDTNITEFGSLLTLKVGRVAVPEGAGFNLLGFILVMSAAVMSGFRWTVTQLLLQVYCYFLILKTATLNSRVSMMGWLLLKFL